MTNFLKTFLENFQDSSEEIREKSVEIVTELLSRNHELEEFLPYIFSILIDSVNCEDLEGIEGLPDVMKPSPSQKPHVMLKLVERSE